MSTSSRPFRRAALVLTLAACAAQAAPKAALAAWPHDPYSGGLPVSAAANLQSNPQACSDNAGGAIIVWQDSRNATGPDIYVQRISAAGSPLWTANGVLVCNAANDQSIPTIAADGAGGAVITWQDLRSGSSYDIYAQRVNANGATLWTANGVAVSTAANGQLSPVIVSDGAGGAVIAWNDNRVSSIQTDIYAQRLNGSGTPQWTANGVALCTATNTQDQVQLVSDGVGGAIATWEDFRVISAAHIYAQRVNGGSVQWTADGVAICTAAGQQIFPGITTDQQGGAIIAWQDTRNGSTNSDIFAQHVNSLGTTQWTGNGVPVCTRTANQQDARIASDGSGGAIVTWDDLTNANYDVYVQRINAGGAPVWTLNGINMINSNGNQTQQVVLGDGFGGAVLAWTDQRGGVDDDVYFQHVLSDGSLLLASGGQPACAANRSQSSPVLVADGQGGAIVAFGDGRADASDVYAQHIAYGGALGSPEPVILSVRDVPNDQGGFVKLTWQATYLDFPAAPDYVNYRVWRSVPMHALAARAAALHRGITQDPAEAVRTGRLWTGPFAASDYAWEEIGYSNAVGFAQYSLVVATTSDSVAGSNPRTAFMVQVETRPQNTYVYYSSAPDSGYSVDNLPPAAPAPFSAVFDGSAAHLTWIPGTEPDVEHYQVYRGVSAGFVPGPGSLYATTTEASFDDVAATPYVYKVTTVDRHGNESPVTTFYLGATTGVAPDAPGALALAPPSPNPARGATQLRFALSREGRVRLAVYDASGRRVRSLVEESLPAGEHHVTFALSDAGGRPLASGIYLVRLEAEGRVLTRRVLAVR